MGKLLDETEAVDVDGRQPVAERCIIPGADGGAVHPGELRVLSLALYPQASGWQARSVCRFGPVRPQPAGMVEADQTLGMPDHLEAAVRQHVRRRGAEIFRKVDEHDHLLVGDRVNRAEVRAELPQPQAWQDAGAAIGPADLYVAVHDARAAERMGDGIGIEIRNR